MAYPTPPGLRMAYDRDGTVGVQVYSGAIVGGQFSAAEMQTLNNENDDSLSSVYGTHKIAILNNQPSAYTFIFPELRDLAGYFIAANPSGGGTLPTLACDTSANTTNGVDGTWTQSAAAFSYSLGNGQYWRNAITTLSVAGIKAIRFNAQATGGGNEFFFESVHLYGGITAGQNVDRLRLWHPTLDQEVAAGTFDYGDIARSTAATIQFRVKNNSATLTANSIQLSLDVLSDSSPAKSTELTLSSDNVSFFTTINIGNLAPSAISPVLYLKNTLGASAALGLWAVRLNAVATSFS